MQFSTRFLLAAVSGAPLLGQALAGYMYIDLVGEDSNGQAVSCSSCSAYANGVALPCYEYHEGGGAGAYVQFDGNSINISQTGRCFIESSCFSDRPTCGDGITCGYYHEVDCSRPGCTC